jgi:hypothetical protein
MSDNIYIYTPTQNLQVATGKGLLSGVIVTSSSTTPALCSIYDYFGAGPPAIKIFEVEVASPQPVIIFFQDRFAPRFAAGLWLITPANVYVTMFVFRQA